MSTQQANPAPSSFTGYSTQYTYKVPDYPWGIGTYQGHWVRGRPEGHGVFEEITQRSGEGIVTRVRYAGDWKAGEMEGRGEVRYSSGQTYSGSFQGGEREGRGINTWSSGAKYEGDWKGDKREGRGIHTWPDGEKYEGDYKGGKREGRGIYTYPDGEKYEGDYKGGKREGRGIHTYPSGEKYEGDYKGGEREGRGIYTFPSGEKYEGDFKGDKFEGRGIYTWPDGRKYEGDYKGDKREGRGILTFPSGAKYEGDYKGGKFEGRGIYTWPDGEKYEGDYKGDKREGRGIYTWPDGEKYEGDWKGGEKEGEGTYTASNGRQFHGLWTGNKLNGTQSLGDLDEEAKRLGPPPGGPSSSSTSSTSSTSSIETKEKEKENERKKEEEERKRQKEKRDAVFVELERLEISLKEKQHSFSHYIQTQIHSGGGDPALLLDQLKGLTSEVDAIRIKVENKKHDLSLLRTTNEFSYYDEVNRKRENLLITCKDIKKEINQAMQTLQQRKKDLDKKVEEDKKEEEEEEEEKRRQQRASGYTAFFKDEMRFKDEDIQRYRKGLIELGLDSKEDFENAVQSHLLIENPSSPSNGNTPLFKPFHFTKILSTLNVTPPPPNNILPPSPPSSPSPLQLNVKKDNHEYRLRQNDVLFPNGKFYLDSSLTLGGLKNIFPIYFNNDEARPLILKIHENPTLRDAECQILKELRHKDYIVSYIEKMDFVNHSICRTLEEMKLYHGLILERGKWDLSKKIQTSEWKSSSIDEKIIYAKQILEIVEYINDKGFIWRDIKPTNFVYFSDELNINGKLKGIDFDISLPQGTLIEDRQSTSFYTPPEVAKVFQSRFSTNEKIYVNETYDSWSSGMLILEMFDNYHFINTEMYRNHPNKAKSREDSDILHRLAEETFLIDLQNYIDAHHKNKAVSYPILTSLLCEHTKRKSVKEVLSMSCLRLNATSKTAKFINEIKRTIEEMKTVIIEEISAENLAQYTHLKSTMHQIQYSIPKDRVSLENFLSTELSRVITCIQKHSSQTEIINLRNTLLDELSSSQSSLEDITAQLEEGFQIINDSLEEVQATFDTMTQSMVDFELMFIEKLNSLNSKDIDLNDVEDIIDTLNVTQRDIEKLQGKENLKKKDVMKLIMKSVSAIHVDLDSLKLSNKEALDRLEGELRSKCEQSVENDHQLKDILINLAQVVTNIHQKLDNLSNTI